MRLHKTTRRLQVYLLFFSNLTWQNSNLSTWSSAFSPKKKNTNTDNFFPLLEFDVFRIQLKIAFRIRPRVCFITAIYIHTWKSQDWVLYGSRSLLTLDNLHE